MSHARRAANHHPLLRALLVALVVGLVASTIFAQVKERSKPRPPMSAVESSPQK